VLEEVLKNDGHLETSSAYDMYIVKELLERGILNKENYIVCNGFKRPLYTDQIAELVNSGCENLISILDNKEELETYKKTFKKKAKIGIRIASEEEPTFDFYTSRLGIRYIDIIDFYNNEIKNNPKFELKMLHFFINTGIKDNIYYWSE
jgi:arginine decarboxylase